MRQTMGVATMGVAIAVLLTGCAADTAPGEGQALSGQVVVYAAASLTESFGEIADAFTASHPGVTVTFSFGGSSSLADGILAGAPVDVFASASPATMATVTDARLVEGEPTVFAGNSLEIAVPAGNPGDISGLDDLADVDKVIALCAPEVPCGAVAAEVFAEAGITAAPDSLEQDVRAALTKVELGEVDAAMVYRTDVLAAGDAVEGIEFPEAAGAESDYPIATLSGGPNPSAAAAFVAFVLSEKGQEILDNAGFRTH